MDEDADISGPDPTKITVIDNVTYCWDEAMQSYTWCPTESTLYPVPVGVLILLSSFYGLISIASVVGNTLVIFVVATSKSMQNVTNLFIANLAVSDVIIALFCIPFQFYAALLQRWDLPEFMCKFCPFMQILSVNVSIFTLVAISLDRYRAIITPLHAKVSKFVAKLIIAVIWMLSVLVALPTGFLFKFSHVYDDVNGGLKPFCAPEDMVMVDYPNVTPMNSANHISTVNVDNNETVKLIKGDFDVLPRGVGLVKGGGFKNPSQNESEDITGQEEGRRALGLFEIYGISLMVIEYAFPLVIISIAYARMGIKLWLTKTPGAAQDKRDECILSNKKKVIKMLFVVVLLFCLCWLPWHLYHCLILIRPDINQYRYINIIFFASHWLAMSNSCYNPFVYAIYSEKFKKEFKECTHCPMCRVLLLGRRFSQNDSPWNQTHRPSRQPLNSRHITRQTTMKTNSVECGNLLPADRSHHHHHDPATENCIEMNSITVNANGQTMTKVNLDLHPIVAIHGTQC